MTKLEDLTQRSAVKGILPNQAVTVVNVKWHGSDVKELTYKDASGLPDNTLLYRDNEATLEVAEAGRAWTSVAMSLKARSEIRGLC